MKTRPTLSWVLLSEYHSSTSVALAPGSFCGGQYPDRTIAPSTNRTIIPGPQKAQMS